MEGVSTSDENDDDVGSVKVQVSKSAVHRSVRNIMNEMKLNPTEIRDDVKKKTEDLIRAEVLDYISKTGYNKADLYSAVKRAMDHRLNDLKDVLKEVVRELVHKQITEQIGDVVAILIKEGVEIKVGWKPTKVKVSMEGEQPK